MFDKNKVIEKLKSHKPYINGSENMRKAAVFIPIVQNGGEPHILFEVRASTLNHRPSEISFPGGGIEPGEKPFEAAIRETHEEIGVQERDLKIITDLDLLVTPVSYIIHPYVGYLDSGAKLSLNKDEVDHVFTVPLKYLLENQPKMYQNIISVTPASNLPFEYIPGGKNYKFEKGPCSVIFYKYEDYIIWGITAKILYNFLEFFKYEDK